MKIGIIGSGEVGQTLANAFHSEGHEVQLGTRDVSKPGLKNWQKENPSINLSNFQDTAKFGEVLVLCTKGDVAESVIKLAGMDAFIGKILIDVTNPIAPSPPQNGVLKLFTTQNESLMERIQKLVPGAHVVKAFNSVGCNLMYQPKTSGGKPTMFICGNNETAKKVVSDFLTAFGWETEDMGKVEAARAIEPLCILWCIPGFLRNDWSHAFKMVKAQ